jgi:hypothetical protein
MDSTWNMDCQQKKQQRCEGDVVRKDVVVQEGVYRSKLTARQSSPASWPQSKDRTVGLSGWASPKRTVSPQGGGFVN